LEKIKSKRFCDITDLKKKFPFLLFLRIDTTSDLLFSEESYTKKERLFMKYKAPSLQISQNNSLASYMTLARETSLIDNLSTHFGHIQKIQICPIEKTIFFNKISLDLSHQPKIFLVFYSLYLAKEDGLDRDELIKKVYTPCELEISERQTRCYRHNIIKLLSRARFIAKEFFGDEYFKADWFPHSGKLKRWYLCRPDLENFRKNLR